MCSTPIVLNSKAEKIPLIRCVVHSTSCFCHNFQRRFVGPSVRQGPNELLSVYVCVFVVHYVELFVPMFMLRFTQRNPAALLPSLPTIKTRKPVVLLCCWCYHCAVCASSSRPACLGTAGFCMHVSCEICFILVHRRKLAEHATLFGSATVFVRPPFPREQPTRSSSAMLSQ